MSLSLQPLIITLLSGHPLKLLIEIVMHLKKSLHTVQKPEFSINVMYRNMFRTYYSKYDERGKTPIYPHLS